MGGEKVDEEGGEAGPKWRVDRVMVGSPSQAGRQTLSASWVVSRLKRSPTNFASWAALTPQGQVMRLRSQPATVLKANCIIHKSCWGMS